MYNYSYTLTYRKAPNDTQYRKELLGVFGLTEYSSDLASNIEKLYTDMPHHFSEILAKLPKTSGISKLLVTEKSLFFLLFCWENFQDTHRYLGEIMSNNTNIINEKERLIEHLTQ